ncbi:hypothetical protein FB45DRAFT_881025 [Roridomyces roridus]|uniref:Uncharacterized protein n=1 Tax=Roridomyces roridus TaxID=1738132 RepID=A0AAD7F621_9AGAR|nr:hypothetical protein FB45DRAFT_881025 [Roridomyces roridus]
MPCTPHWFASPGHEDRARHDNCARCAYYAVLLGWTTGAYSNAYGCPNEDPDTVNVIPYLADQPCTPPIPPSTSTSTSTSGSGSASSFPPAATSSVPAADISGAIYPAPLPAPSPFRQQGFVKTQPLSPSPFVTTKTEVLTPVVTRKPITAETRVKLTPLGLAAANAHAVARNSPLSPTGSFTGSFTSVSSVASGSVSSVASGSDVDGDEDEEEETTPSQTDEIHSTRSTPAPGPHTAQHSVISTPAAGVAAPLDVRYTVRGTGRVFRTLDAAERQQEILGLPDGSVMMTANESKMAAWGLGLPFQAYLKLKKNCLEIEKEWSSQKRLRDLCLPTLIKCKLTPSLDATAHYSTRLSKPTPPPSSMPRKKQEDSDNPEPNAEPKRPGKDSDFAGSRLEFLRARLPTFLAIGTQVPGQEKAHGRVLAGLALTEEPPTPSEDAGPADADAAFRAMGVEDLSEEEEKQRSTIQTEMSEMLQKLRRWFHRQRAKKTTIRGNPFFSHLKMMRKCDETSAPRLLPDWQYYMQHDDHKKKISDAFEKAGYDKEPSNQHLTLRGALARDFLAKETEEERQRLEDEQAATHAAALEESEETEEGMPSVDPEIQKHCRENFETTILPLLAGLRAYTGFTINVVAAHIDTDGTVTTKSANAGTVHSKDWAQWAPKTYGPMLQQFLRFAHADYLVPESESDTVTNGTSTSTSTTPTVNGTSSSTPTVTNGTTTPISNNTTAATAPSTSAKKSRRTSKDSGVVAPPVESIKSFFIEKYLAQVVGGDNPVSASAGHMSGYFGLTQVQDTNHMISS